MDRALLGVILASLAGLGLMSAVATLSHPPRVALGDLPGHVGVTVTTTARIVELDVHESGWTRLLLTDANLSLDATVGAAPDASPGDVVDATGVVLRTGARLRLQIEHPDDVIVRVAWQDQHETLRRLLDRPWALHDAHVVTSGEYQRTGTSAYLEDGDHRVRTFGTALQAWEPGMRLRVSGVLEYDAATAAFRLRVDEARPA